MFDAFKMNDVSVYGSILFFSILYSPISMIVEFLFNAISRTNEFSADKYSAETTDSPNTLIDALQKMAKENLTNLTPHWLYVMLNYSHPPILDRINVLKSFIK